MLPVYTIGHSTRSIDEFAALLGIGQVRRVVDIRTVPRSRANPQYNEDALPASLAELGGLRKRERDVPPEVNGYWSNRSFHNYADYALSEEFRRGLERLRALADDRATAIMCDDAVWWRCHRRIVADWLIGEGREVFHLMDPARADPARMTPGAVRQERGIVYPSPAPEA